MLTNCGWFREETQEQLKGLGMGMTGAQGGHMPKDGRLTLPGAPEKRLRGNLSLSVSTCLGAVISDERAFQFVSQKDNRNCWL